MKKQLNASELEALGLAIFRTICEFIGAEPTAELATKVGNTIIREWDMIDPLARKDDTPLTSPYRALVYCTNAAIEFEVRKSLKKGAR